MTTSLAPGESITDLPGRMTAHPCEARVIAARLFLSPRTVKWHLPKVYAKRDVRNRDELARVVRSQRPEVAPAGSATA